MQYEIETCRLPAGRDMPTETDWRPAKPINADSKDHAEDCLRAGAEAARELGLVAANEHGWARITPAGMRYEVGHTRIVCILDKMD